MNKKWKKIKSRIAYKNPWFRVREDEVIRPDGKKGVYGIVERPHVNFIIALTKSERIIFIEEFRYPVRRVILQLPAGTTNSGENDLQAAKRELHQEAGYKAQIWEKIGSFFIAPGHESIMANVFLAEKCEKSTASKRKISNELITKVRNISMLQIKKMIGEDKIKCGITLATLNVLFQRIKK